MPKGQLQGIVEKAKTELTALTGFASPSGIGIEKEEKGWRVTVEVLEKLSIPDSQDVLGIYAVHFDGNGALMGYERVGHRRRSDVEGVGERTV